MEPEREYDEDGFYKPSIEQWLLMLENADDWMVIADGNSYVLMSLHTFRTGGVATPNDSGQERFAGVRDYRIEQTGTYRIAGQDRFPI